MQPHHDDECNDLEEPNVCAKLAQELECVLNPTYMTVHCRSTCGKCPITDEGGVELEEVDHFPSVVMTISKLQRNGDAVSIIAVAIFAAVLIKVMCKLYPWKRSMLLVKQR